MNNKSNYIYLGVSIAYFIIYIIQSKLSTPLDIKIYYTITLVSFEFSLIEFIKSSIKIVNKITKYRIYSSELTKLFEEKNIRVLSKFTTLNKISLEHKGNLEKEEKRIDIESCRRSITILEKVYTIFTVFQILFCTVQIIISPVIDISSYENIDNTINLLTLLTFSCMFLSYFASQYDNVYENSLVDKLELKYATGLDYLDIIDSIAKENTVKEREKNDA